MTKMLIIFSLVLLGCSQGEQTDVVTLTDSNFDDFIKNHPKTLVEFYAPWCGHCKKLTPEYEKAATSLKSKSVYLAKVDATEEKALASRFSIKGFPTLIWFPEGLEGQEYDGGRTAKTIEEWIELMGRPPVKEIESPQEPGSTPTVTLYGPNFSKNFEAVAGVNRKLASWCYIKSDVTKIAIHHKDEDVIESDDKSVIESIDELKKFWSSNAFPIFGALNVETFNRYMGRTDYGLVWTLFPFEKSEDMDGVISSNRAMMVNVAKANPKYSFTYTDTVMFKDVIKNSLGVKKFPAMVVFKKATDKQKYIFQDEMSESTLSAFIADVEADKVQPAFKSEEIPSENTEAVRVVVGQSLLEEAFSPKKDVLLEIYSPRCGHCKKFEPEYNALAEKVKAAGADDILTIAKLDGSVNESPTELITWTSVPTIYYIKAGSSEPMKYTEERTADALLEWLKENHSMKEEFAAKFKVEEANKKEKEEL